MPVQCAMTFTRKAAGEIFDSVVEYLCNGHDQVSVHLLAKVTVLSGMTLCAVRSLMIVILYGRHMEADNA